MNSSAARGLLLFSVLGFYSLLLSWIHKAFNSAAMTVCIGLVIGLPLLGLISYLMHEED